MPHPNHLSLPVLHVARHDYAALNHQFSVREALDNIRQQGLGERIIYFYVVDDEGRLLGVLPSRRLLTAPLDDRLVDLMDRGVVSIPEQASILQACQLLIQRRFLALPVVDAEGRLCGLVDIALLNEESYDLRQRDQADALFETLGFHVAQVGNASPLWAFRLRVPWLLATIASGTACAVLASLYELTLAKSLVLAFFLTLVLGLGESVSMQSMSVTIQALRSVRPDLAWYLRCLRHEMPTAVLLGTTCGSLVWLIVWLWRDEAWTGLIIGSSILLSLCAACLLGLSVPAALHAAKLDPKIAAGPVTLAITDICTLLFYFSLAAWLL
ncbi:magnesium transporter [Ectopseudomonas hydrolytica]|uniref:Magnesium transporter n=1 Tax=Ectopseudomonas hydrolytica TaxID=2493633 RepID=A0ABY5AAR6_9GAMM|nr:magnesium transporter [Pseudomonas hydrolytica]ARS47969.1 magnesium transporter MgtE [Pseudomonas mendocina]USR40994.1 magnesium transporter [Pseudomonas hydrolytica]